MHLTRIQQPPRIRNIDIIRGVAVLGIFAINATDMAYPQDIALDFLASDPARGWNYHVALTLETLFAGKMRGLFTLLFGASSVLIIERWSRNSGGLIAADYYFRRLWWLLALGLVNAYLLLWWGDVLFKYAILGMLLFPLRNASRLVLSVAVLACLTLLTAWPYAQYRQVVELERQYIGAQSRLQSAPAPTPGDAEIVARWQDLVLDTRPDPEMIEEEVLVKSGNYAGIFDYNRHRVFEEQTAVFYAEDVWDMLLFMVLGVLLLRVGFFDGRVSQSIHLAIAILGIGAGLGVHAWLNNGLYANYTDPVMPDFYLIFFDLGRVPFVMGYVSLIILVLGTARSGGIGDALAAVGRMALSNYLVQSVIGALVFYGFGLALFNELSRGELALLVLLVWLAQITASVAWMRWFRYGPVEWLWRSLTCWQVQPLLRKAAG